MSYIPDRYMKMVVGDFNAKVGNCNFGNEQVMSTHGLGYMIEIGVHLVSICTANSLIKGGTKFKHKDTRDK